MNSSTAFSVHVHEHTLLTDSPLVYEIVDLNIGDGYNEFTGESHRYNKKTHKYENPGLIYQIFSHPLRFA